MRRRDFITILAGASLSPVVAGAQKARTLTLGILLPGADNDQGYKSDLQVLLLELEKLGGRTDATSSSKFVGVSITSPVCESLQRSLYA